MKTLKCKCGEPIMLDDDNYNKFAGTKFGCNARAVTERVYVGGRKTIHIQLSRQVIDIPTGMEPDHIDHNIHNNQRSNLRPTTKEQNRWNRRKMKNNTSGSIGVSFNASSGRWQATIRENGNMHFLGLFDTVIEAELARDKAALKYHGEFAVLNKPPII